MCNPCLDHLCYLCIDTAHWSRPPFSIELLCRTVAKRFGHFPKGLVKFHILVDALDCPGLRHPATIWAEPGRVTLAAPDDVLLDLCGVDRYVERTDCDSGAENYAGGSKQRHS